MAEKNWTHWIEIPALDFQRAVKFYETIFNIKTHVDDFGGFKMAVFPHETVGAAICWSPNWYKPSMDGVTVYLDANPDLNETLQKIEPAGGKILQAKKQISPEIGFMALFTDSEGNRMALFSKS